MELRIQRNVDHIRKLRLEPRKQVLSSELITLGYNEVRHAAAPIGQYILEIFPRDLGRLYRRRDR